MSEDNPLMSDERLWFYLARVLRVVDGDTLDLMVDLGFQSYIKMRVRLYGIDTPETYGVSKDSEEYAAGKRATAFVEAWAAAQEQVVLIKSHDGRQLAKTGKYGRYIVQVFATSGGKTLNEVLVERGLAEEKDYG